MSFSLKSFITGGTPVKMARNEKKKLQEKQTTLESEGKRLKPKDQKKLQAAVTSTRNHILKLVVTAVLCIAAVGIGTVIIRRAIRQILKPQQATGGSNIV